jgi:hypothetical protein
VRGDLEAWLAGCPQRFGILRPGRPPAPPDPRLPVPDGFDEARHHQLELWDGFLRHFGLDAQPDFAPRPRGSGPGPPPADGPIGLIAGSENDPSKRWPVAAGGA